MLKIAYGEKIYQEHGQELITLNKETVRHLGAVRTTFYLVSVIPLCMFPSIFWAHFSGAVLAYNFFSALRT
jgi:hypothetical protein